MPSVRIAEKELNYFRLEAVRVFILSTGANLLIASDLFVGGIEHSMEMCQYIQPAEIAVTVVVSLATFVESRRRIWATIVTWTAKIGARHRHTYIHDAAIHHSASLRIVSVGREWQEEEGAICFHSQAENWRPGYSSLTAQISTA